MFYAILFNQGVCDRRTDTEFSPYHDDYEQGPAPTCPRCNKYVGALTWLPPYDIRVELHGDKFGDVARFSSELLVSERFTSLWCEHGLTGLNEFHTVNIKKVINHKRTAATPPVYRLTTVCRSLAAIDLVASGFDIEHKPNQTICPHCRSGGIIKRWKRVVMEPDTWDGLDIFWARGLPGTLFASERFADFCRQFNITNVPLVPIDQYARDFYPMDY